MNSYNVLKKRILNLFPLIFLIFCLIPGSLFAQKKIYYIQSQFSSIQRANDDGTGVEDLVQTRLDSPRDIEMDNINGVIYWSETGKLLSMDLNSGVSRTIIEYQPEGAFTLTIPAIALDPLNNKIYWIADNSIWSANSDGSGQQELINQDILLPLSLAVDPENQKLYWSGTGGYIRRGNMDGTEIEDLVTDDIFEPMGISLDLANGKIYWADLVANEINRANLDGSESETVISGDLENPSDVVIDSENSQIYWLDTGRTGISGLVQSASTDGTGIEDLVAEIDDPVAITADLENNRIFYLNDSRPAAMEVVSFDGTGFEVFLKELSGFEFLQIYEPLDKIYWMDFSTGNIMRANSDGSMTELVVETSGGLEFVLDPVNEKIYWSESDAIRMANVDGGEITGVITSGVDQPSSLLINTDNNKIYWVDGGFSSENIKWANLDGSGLNDLHTGLDGPSALQLDDVNDKLYWLEGGTFPTDLWYSGTDGSSPASLANEGSGINSYSVIPEEGSLFYSSRDIISSDLDGSNANTVYDDSRVLSGLAADSEIDKVFWYVREGEYDYIWKAGLDGSNAGMIIGSLFTSSDREILIYGKSTTSVFDNQFESKENPFYIFPNPATENVKLSFSLKSESEINLRLYDITGNYRLNLMNKELPAGPYQFDFNLEEVPNGIYFIRLETLKYSYIRKLIITR